MSRADKVLALAVEVEARLQRRFPRITVYVTPTDYAQRLTVLHQRGLGRRQFSQYAQLPPVAELTPHRIDAITDQLGAAVLRDTYPTGWAVPA